MGSYPFFRPVLLDGRAVAGPRAHDRLECLGKKNKDTLYAVTSARNQILAARARLVVLQKRDGDVTRNGVKG